MFYENYDRICKARGTSASAAAMAINRTKSAASAWKANGTLPKEKELIALAKHLRCRVADFFREDGQAHFGSRDEMVDYWRYVDSINPLSEGPCHRDAGEEQNDLLKLYDALDKKSRAELMVQVYNFAEERNVEL